MSFTPIIEDDNPEMLALRMSRAENADFSSLPKDPKKHIVRFTTENVSGKKLIDLGLSIVHPFYNNKERFDIQLSNWGAYSSIIKQRVNFLIVDDGSSPPVHTYITNQQRKRLDLNTQIYRIMKDIKWNTPGALNLGVMKAKNDWVLIMDSDCLLKPESIFHLMDNFAPKEDWFYYFPRKRITDDPVKEKITRYLPCAILFNKKSFFTVGGFDEDFVGANSGGYGIFDNHFEILIGRYGYVRGFLKDINITEYILPNDKPSYTREHINKNLRTHYDKITKRKPINRNIINFEWEKSFESERW